LIGYRVKPPQLLEMTTIVDQQKTRTERCL